MGPLVTIGPKEYNYLSVISWSLTWGGLCRTDWNNKLAILHNNGFLPQNEFLNIAKILNMSVPSWLNLNWTWNNRELKKNNTVEIVITWWRSDVWLELFPQTPGGQLGPILPQPSNRKRRPISSLPFLSWANQAVWWGEILSSPHAKYKLAFQNREDIKPSIICKSIRIKDQPGITNSLQSSFYRTRVRSLSLPNWLTDSLMLLRLDWCDPGV